MDILFPLVTNEQYLPMIFELLDTFTKEDHYYVNMVNAWLLCECFIKQREPTLKYLAHHQLNQFTINKAIQKCHDSHRVSAADKAMLLRYKQ